MRNVCSYYWSRALWEIERSQPALDNSPEVLPSEVKKEVETRVKSAKESLKRESGCRSSFIESFIFSVY
jgi:hypothetical protein